MLKKMLFAVAAFGIAVASAKSYSVKLADPYTIGSTQLKPGNYRVTVNGTSAVLADPQKKIQVNGTIQNETRKFDDTAVVSTQQRRGASELKAIELGGTHMQVNFN